MGRAISDGISDAYIQDVLVLPEYRRHAIGKQIMKTLINHCHKHHIEWIGLIAEPGSIEFYLTLDFQPMKNHIPMLLKNGVHND
jgi:GNAT superfamily N-acetyltransferase